MKFLRCAPLAALVGLALVANPVQATFHLWDIVEAYSNFDGSVQFVEMFDASNSENLVGGKQLKSNSHTFTIPANLSTIATANHRLLFATAGFSALAGGVTPDYTIPSNFFSITGDTLNFANVDIRTFPSIPTDGVMSLNFPSNTAAVNSPTNFAGAAGSIDLSSPTTTGDYNGDGTVNAADYTVWRNALGQEVSSGSGADGIPDGAIDGADYDFWKLHFGETVPGSASGQASVVPEPATVMLMLVGLLTVIISRKFSPRGAGQG
jgi:Dockerin type I domain